MSMKMRSFGKMCIRDSVEGVVHVALRDVARRLDLAEDGRHGVGGLLDAGRDARRQRARDVFVEAAARDVADGCLLYTSWPGRG